MKLNNKLMKPIISSCTYDTNIFGTPHRNRLIRTGNVVELIFIAPVIAQPSGSTNIITNLPKFASGDDIPFSSWVGADRFIPNANSTPKQLWTTASNSIRTGRDLLVSGNWLFVSITYITND